MIDEKIEDFEIDEILKDKESPKLTAKEKARLAERAFSKVMDEYNSAIKAMGDFVSILQRLKGIEDILGKDLYSWLCSNIGKETDCLNLGPLFQLFDPDGFFSEFRKDNNGAEYPSFEDVKKSQDAYKELVEKHPKLKESAEIIREEK